MKSEEYYAHLDTIKRQVDSVLEIMDNETIETIDIVTHELIYLINKWREKNGLPRYKEIEL
jgi:hypothetical protein